MTKEISKQDLLDLKELIDEWKPNMFKNCTFEQLGDTIYVISKDTGAITGQMPAEVYGDILRYVEERAQNNE